MESRDLTGRAQSSKKIKDERELPYFIRTTCCNNSYLESFRTSANSFTGCQPAHTLFAIIAAAISHGINPVAHTYIQMHIKIPAKVNQSFQMYYLKRLADTNYCLQIIAVVTKQKFSSCIRYFCSTHVNLSAKIRTGAKGNFHRENNFQEVVSAFQETIKFSTCCL